MIAGAITNHITCLSGDGPVAAQPKDFYDEPNWRMDGGRDGRRNVALDGNRHTGGGPAGRRHFQAVQQIIVHII